jgi:hypothetical protein
MNIEIKLHNYHIKLENVVVEDYSADFDKLRKSFENNIIDFSTISRLKGEKTMLENSFQQTKQELLDYGK